MTETAEEFDNRANNILATGGIHMALMATPVSDLRTELVITEDGMATNQIRVRIPLMKSTYIITIERDTSEDDEATHAQ